MSEEKSVRQLERELKQARIKEGAEQRSNVTLVEIMQLLV